MNRLKPHAETRRPEERTGPGFPLGTPARTPYCHAVNSRRPPCPGRMQHARLGRSPGSSFRQLLPPLQPDVVDDARASEGFLPDFGQFAPGPVRSVTVPSYRNSLPWPSRRRLWAVAQADVREQRIGT